MALRRRVAERIATPLKRAGVETPILEEIPHKAEEITAFYYEAVQSSGQVTELLRLPAFAHGKAYGETAGFWYRVTFPKPIRNPSVACIAEARKGEIPTVKIPPISIPKISVSTISMPKIAEVTVPTDIGIPTIPVGAPKFTWVCTGPLCGFTPYKEIGEAMDAVAEVLNTISDNVMEVQNRINQIIFRINEVLKKIIDTAKALDAKIDDLRDKADVALQGLRVNADTALEELRANTESCVNSGLNAVLPALYTLWGIPRTMVATPIHVRNVTDTGFEFQSLGKTTIWWLAIGTRA